MPKDFFKTKNMTPLNSIPKGGSIHLIGVSGVAMGQLAVELKTMGYNVSGSDKEFYEPMGSFLENSNVILKRGYDASNVPLDINLVVIGNAISYGHAEVAVVEEKNLPYTCFPKLLCESIISGKHSIVVAGTHGKSTTTAMTATILRDAGIDPSYFIGGVVEGFPTSLHNGTGGVSVVEGDEYDDVFFSKKAKFTHYQPNTFIVNAIEYDHADLYPNLDSVKQAFASGAALVPANGQIVACLDFPVVEEMTAEWRKSLPCKVVTFGSHPNADYRIVARKAEGFGQTATVKDPEGKEFTLELPVIGEYNARNAIAALIATTSNGVSREKALSILKTYRAVKRRQEIRYNANGVVLIEDFAHHPTAVHATLQSVRDAYPDKRIWAVFEPRSNTSRRKVFENDYLKSFSPANEAILAEVVSRAVDTGHDLLDVNELAVNITKSGVPCAVLPNAEVIADSVMGKIGQNDVVVIMSNGGFGGLPAMMQGKLEGRGKE